MSHWRKPMHTVQLALTTSKEERSEINRRFHALSHIHNVLVSHARKLLVCLEHDMEYQGWLASYVVLKDKEADTGKGLSKTEKELKKVLSTSMDTRRKEIGLSKAGLESYIKVCGRRYSKLLSSQQVQAEADRVWESVKDCLFGDGKEVHFKPFGEFHTIGGKSNGNGAKFLEVENGDGTKTWAVSWTGLTLECRLPKKLADREYILESLGHKVKYCMVKRRQFNSGWKYYAVVVLDGNAPMKREVGNGDGGIDPGVSTMAVMTDDACFLEELAPKAAEYERKIAEVQRRMDASKRATNPGRFNADGTYKKGSRGKWKLTDHYMHLKRQLRTLHRKKSEYTPHSHREACNRILKAAKHFFVEKMDYAALKKRSKKTERQESASAVEQKDGSLKLIHKYKKKKRFGHSITSRSPSRFLTELRTKAELYGGSYHEVNTKTYKASQYDHTTGTCTKIPLSQRSKEVGGHTVQRDLYSAFLIKYPDLNLEHPDRDKCAYEFQKFLRLHGELIAGMKENKLSMKQCFGF